MQQPGTIPAELNNSTTTTTTASRPDTIPAPLPQLTDSTATTTAAGVDIKPIAPPPPLPPSTTPAKLNESHTRASLMGASTRQVGKLATSFGTTTCKPKDGNLDLVLREATRWLHVSNDPNQPTGHHPRYRYDWHPTTRCQIRQHLLPMLARPPRTATATVRHVCYQPHGSCER